MKKKEYDYRISPYLFIGIVLGVFILLFFIAIDANAMVLKYDDVTGEKDKVISDNNIYGTRVLSDKVQLVIYGNFVDNFNYDNIGNNYDVKNDKVRVYSGQKYLSDDGQLWFTARYATTSLDEYFKATTKEVSSGFFKYIFPYANAQSVSTTTMAGDGFVKDHTCMTEACALTTTNGSAADYTSASTASNHHCRRADGYYFANNSFLPFGTHFLGVDYVDYSIATASVFIKSTTENGSSEQASIGMWLSTTTQASVNSLVTADIDNINVVSVVSDEVTMDGNDTWHEFEITATSTINENDYTKYGLVDECWYNQSYPVGSFYRSGWYYVESAGNEPYLEIGLYYDPGEATSTPEATSTTSLPCDMSTNRDLSFIYWCEEEYTDSTTTPSKTTYGYMQIVFIPFFIFAFIFFWIGNRLILELIIRWRK